MKKLTCIFLALTSLNALAISEINYKHTYTKKIIPLIQNMYDGTMYSNGLNLHYKTLTKKNATKCLIILPGRQEPVEKYAELVYDLKQSEIGQQLNFFLLDHRGQGSSDRMAQPIDMGHVDYFDNYVSDVKNFLSTVVTKYDCQKKFLFAHSMGAGIGLNYILKNPHYFDAMAISSPMLKIQTNPYPYFAANALVASLVTIGKGDKFSVGQGHFNFNDRFEENKFTTSKVRFEMTMDIYRAYIATPVGGASNNWVNEAMKGTKNLRKNYHLIKTPTKLFRAGTELYSDPNEMIKFCNELENCEDFLYPTAKHEVVNDRDENRNAVINELIELYSR